MTYKIEYSVGATTKADTISYPAQMHTIPNLMKGTTYSVRISLNNSAGMGDYSPAEPGHTDVDCECLNTFRSYGVLFVTCDQLYTYW